jgi:transcription elongation factor Elf1
MGNEQPHKSKTKTKTKNKNSKNLIIEQITCPFCKKLFNSSTTINALNYHIKLCGVKFIQINKECEIFPPSQDYELNELIYQNSKKYIALNIDKTQTMEQKIEKLKAEIKKVKISWEEGSDTLNLNRNNMLSESMEQINKVNLHKEVKINFIGEVSYDAGGIMREWFTTIFQTLEGEKLKLFVVSDANEFSYIINPFLSHKKDNFAYFTFIGKLIVKALFDNITVNICFNKLIYKMILQEKITYDDLVFIDSPLYSSLKNLKETHLFDNPKENESTIKDLELYYSLEMKDNYNHMHSLELQPNGRKTPLLDLDDFIKKRIDFMIGMYEPFIKIIRETIFNFIPKEAITAFTSDEFELILNGRPFIDVEEWKIFTEYKEPYNANHYIILWFWEIVTELSQKELSNLLLFSTGSGRVPLGGFEVLESNRGNIARFTIESTTYVKGCKNFIKAHTCFNRLDIPLFEKKEELVEALKFITNTEILGFGID